MMAVRIDVHLCGNPVGMQGADIIKAAKHGDALVFKGVEEKTWRCLIRDKVRRGQSFSFFQDLVSKKIDTAAGVRAKALGNQVNHRITQDLCAGEK